MADPVLLLATLDEFAVVLGKISAQVSFRLQIDRAALRAGVAPSPHGILEFADTTLQAEGETVYHGGGASTKEAVKAKTMEVKDTPKAYDRDYKPREPDREKGKGKGKGKSTAACRYFLSESGCKKGRRQDWTMLALWKQSAHEAGLPSEGGLKPQGEKGEFSGEGEGQVRV